MPSSFLQRLSSSPQLSLQLKGQRKSLSAVQERMIMEHLNLQSENDHGEEAHSLKHDFKCRSFNDRTFDRLQAVNNDDDQEEEEEEEEPHELRRRLSFPFKEQLNEDALKLRKSRGLYPDLSQGSKLHRKTTRMEDESESSYASIVLGKDSTQSMFPGSTVLSSSVTVTVTSSRNQADFAKSALGRIGNKYNENENNNNTMVDSVPALMPYSILLKDETGHTSQTESTAGITRSTTTTARNMDDSLNASCTQSDAAGRSYVGSFGSSATLAVDSSFIQEWGSSVQSFVHRNEAPRASIMTLPSARTSRKCSLSSSTRMPKKANSHGPSSSASALSPHHCRDCSASSLPLFGSNHCHRTLDSDDDESNKKCDRDDEYKNDTAGTGTAVDDAIPMMDESLRIEDLLRQTSVSNLNTQQLLSSKKAPPMAELPEAPKKPSAKEAGTMGSQPKMTPFQEARDEGNPFVFQKPAPEQSVEAAAAVSASASMPTLNHAHAPTSATRYQEATVASTSRSATTSQGSRIWDAYEVAAASRPTPSRHPRETRRIPLPPSRPKLPTTSHRRNSVQEHLNHRPQDDQPVTSYGHLQIVQDNELSTAILRNQITDQCHRGQIEGRNGTDSPRSQETYPVDSRIERRRRMMTNGYVSSSTGPGSAQSMPGSFVVYHNNHDANGNKHELGEIPCFSQGNDKKVGLGNLSSHSLSSTNSKKDVKSSKNLLGLFESGFSLSASSDDQTIEIGNGLRAPLRGTKETKQAIIDDFYVPRVCLGCSLDVFTIADVQYYVCPTCKTVSSADNGVNVSAAAAGGEGEGGSAMNTKSSAKNHGVGLAFTFDTLFQMQAEVMANQQP